VFSRRCTPLDYGQSDASGVAIRPVALRARYRAEVDRLDAQGAPDVETAFTLDWRLDSEEASAAEAFARLERQAPPFVAVLRSEGSGRVRVAFHRIAAPRGGGRTAERP
jgi:hypothetical protein